MKKTLYQNSILAQILCAALIFTFLMPSAAQSQRRSSGGNKRTSTPGKQTTSENVPGEESAGTCSGWRGKITYLEKKQDQRYVSKGQYGWEKYEIQAIKSGEMVLNGGRVGHATLMLESKELVEEESRQKSCCWANMGGCQKETTTVRRHQAITENVAKGEENSSASVHIEGNRYRIELTLPAMRGKMKFKTAGSVKGYCDPKNDASDSQEHENPDVVHRYTPVRVEGTLDPKNPKLLQGSFQPDPDTMITWSLVKTEGDCDEPLTINNLKLAQHRFPNKTEWVETEDSTVDGNQIRLTATVANGSKKAKSGTVTFRETTSGETIGSKPVSVPAESEAEVEIVWDTNGFAWTDAGEKAPEREIVASLADGESVEDKIFVHPKPVILVHGLWSNAAAWSEYQSYLNEAHSFAWKGYAVGADTKVALMNTGNSAGNTEPTFSIRQNADELAKQIRHTRRVENAWHIDIVAHSMGGLISRYYIHNLMTADAPDARPTAAHLVMLGTPNMGSPCADVMYPAYKLAGFEVEALRQLKTSVVAEFNQTITNRKGVKFSILSGVPVPRTCQEKIWGDGVVTIPSALWQIADRAFAPRIHTAITGQEDFLNFVKPRLALGPNKAKQTARLENQTDGEFYAAGSGIGENWLASIKNPLSLLLNLQTAGDNALPQVVSSKAIKIAAGERAEMAVNFQTAQSGVTFAAPPGVTVSLVNPEGETAQTIEAGSAEAAQAFKTFYADRAGNWTLRFENAGEAAANAVVSVWADANPLALEFVELQIENGVLKMQAKLTNNGAPVKGASVAAKINQGAEIAFFDDGKHGDGAANDGIYGATSAKLPVGEAFIEAKAVTSGAGMATANSVLSVGDSK